MRKYKYWKEKHKEDTTKLQLEIKKHIKTIDKLHERFKETQEEDYYYKLWYKERMERIKTYRENDKLLDENTNLKEKLTIEIKTKTLENKKE